MTHVVILVPGIMGSVLARGADIIWPGPIQDLILPFGRMADLLDPNLTAPDVIRSYTVFSEQYASIIADLGRWGFKESDKTLVVAPYDWRKDNADSAKTLAGFIDRAVAHNATEITLIAHSMGGLVSRHYLESGLFAGAAFDKVRTLITLATPHRGAAKAVRLVLGHERMVFLAADQVRLAAEDPKFPAPYQLFPAPGEPVGWIDASGSQLQVRDIYDPATAQALGLKQHNLDAAKAFWATLDIAKKPPNVRYFAFAGTRQETEVGVRLRDAGANKLLPVLTSEPDGGDGTVPTWSAFLPGIQRQFVGGEHSVIYRDQRLRAVLAVLLGVPGTLAGVPRTVEVTIRDRVVAPGDTVRAVIVFPKPITKFSGLLTIEHAAIAANGTVGTLERVASLPATYDGAGLESMALTFTAPTTPGFYVVAFRDTPQADPAGKDELIVQL